MTKNLDLKHCGRIYAAMDADVRNSIRALDDDKAKKLRRALDRLTQVNCWWAEYRVAEIVRSALRDRALSKRVTKKIKRASVIRSHAAYISKEKS